MAKTSEKVLLLGNGINRAFSKNISWDDLTKELMAFCKAEKLKIGDKPFPLFYEEIFAHYRGKTNFNNRSKRVDTALLAKIAAWAKTIPANPLNDSIWKKYNTVLTTNYDYALEGGSRWKYGGTRETRYSLQRKFINQKDHPKIVWHIHGEAEKEQTICQGYDLYSGTLQSMRSFLVLDENRNIYKRIDEYKKSGVKEPVEYLSWMDYFFFADIDIVGLDLNYSEIDLWWLLAFRSRLFRYKKYKINNRIRFFDNTNNKIKKQCKELLKSFDVELVEKREPDWKKFYCDILKQK